MDGKNITRQIYLDDEEYHVMDGNKNTTYQNLWIQETLKSTEGEILELKMTTLEKKKSQLITLHLKEL